MSVWLLGGSGVSWPSMHTPLCVCTSNRSGAAALCQHQRDWCLWSDCLSPAPWKDPPYIYMYFPHCWSSLLLLLWGHWCCLCNCTVWVYACASRKYRVILAPGRRSCINLFSVQPNSLTLCLSTFFFFLAYFPFVCKHSKLHVESDLPSVPNWR